MYYLIRLKPESDVDDFITSIIKLKGVSINTINYKRKVLSIISNAPIVRYIETIEEVDFIEEEILRHGIDL